MTKIGSTKNFIIGLRFGLYKFIKYAESKPNKVANTYAKVNVTFAIYNIYNRII